MSNLLKFYKLTRQKKVLLMEAFVLLAIFQIILSTLEFKRIAARLGAQMQETSKDRNEKEMPLINAVGWAVNRMSKHTFWESKCLVQAMTAKYMLRRRNIKCRLYLGLARDEKQAMIAHAWLRTGDKIITGAKVKENFVTLSTFADI